MTFEDIIQVSLIPTVTFVAMNWRHIEILRRKDRNRRNILIEHTQRLSRVENCLIKELKFDKGTDSGITIED